MCHDYNHCETDLANWWQVMYRAENVFVVFVKDVNDLVNPLKPRQAETKCRHFANGVFELIFFNEICFWFDNSTKFVLQGTVNYI